jgi:hypothetical protein
MESYLARVTRFCAGRYNQLNGPDHALALGYAAILAKLRELPTSSADPERDLLDWLSGPHAETNVDRACKQVLEQAR